MFGLRFTTDVQKRSRNGHPHQSTTGVASASSSHGISACELKFAIGGIIPSSSGMESARPIQKRRVMSRSSGLSSSAEISFGSSAMPHLGHAPGASEMTSGCIGHVHCVFEGANESSGSRAIPHFGQAPGLSETTSGSIGQMYLVPFGAGDGCADAGEDPIDPSMTIAGADV